MNRGIITTMVLVFGSIMILFLSGLVGFILLQHRASGLSATFGGTGSSYVQRRGAEKVEEKTRNMTRAQELTFWQEQTKHLKHFQESKKQIQ